MNILIINHYAGSPALGMEFRPYYLAREWTKQGHKVMIVGGTYSHLRKHQPKCLHETLDAIEYRWIPVRQYQGNGIGRILSMSDFVRKLWSSYKKYIGGFKPNIVVASSTYPLDIYPCRKIAKAYGAKLVYEVHDLWPLSPMEIGGYSKYHPFIMVMQAGEDYCYRHADKVISLLPKAIDHMMERGMNPSKFAYVPNGFDPEEWDKPIPASEAVTKTIAGLRKEGKFIVMYAGGHALSNALDYLLDAMKQLKDQNITLVMIGNGQEKQRLMSRIKDEDISNIVCLDPIPKKEIPSTLALADALYIGWNKNPLYRFGISPNKLFDYMMSGRPIIHSVDAANDWVKDADCGISIDAEDVNGIAKAIKEISSWPESKLNETGNRGMKYCKEHFEYGKLAKEFIDCID